MSLISDMTLEELLKYNLHDEYKYYFNDTMTNLIDLMENNLSFSMRSDGTLKTNKIFMKTSNLKTTRELIDCKKTNPPLDYYLYEYTKYFSKKQRKIDEHAQKKLASISNMGEILASISNVGEILLFHFGCEFIKTDRTIFNSVFGRDSLMLTWRYN